MKKLLSILVLGLVISVLGIGTAQAITVDGYLSPSSEWDVYFFSAGDPQEGDIDDDYNISLLRVWWDDDYAYIMTSVYGTPTLEQIDPSNEDSAYYQWNLDSDDADELPDFYVKLKGNGKDGDGNWIPYLGVYDTSWNLIVQGEVAMNDIVEGRFDLSYLTGYDEPTRMYMKIENQGGDADDRLPDTGWTTRIPEPSSMLLLGMGLFGLAGGVTRKRFKA